MKLRMLVQIAGEGFNLNPGDLTERFPDDEALRLIARRAAVIADPAPEIEMAVRVNLDRETRRKKAKG